MTPYYSDDAVTIYHGDCLSVMAPMLADSVDLVLTDPPYGVSWESNRRQQTFGPIEGDATTDLGLAGLGEAVRLLRGRRHLYAFGAWDLAALPVGGTTELIWDKVTMGSGDVTSPWGPAHEPITFAVKANAAQRRGGTGNGPARLRRASVLRFQRPSGAGVVRHPTEKPVDLLRELIESSSRIGEVVLDPFMGSGSTLKAARLEGRRAIGIEVDERYCEIAAKRLEGQGVLDFGWSGMSAETVSPEVHPFTPQAGCNVCVCGSLRNDPWHTPDASTLSRQGSAVTSSVSGSNGDQS